MKKTYTARKGGLTVRGEKTKSKDKQEPKQEVKTDARSS